jgi:hypothetical protein
MKIRLWILSLVICGLLAACAAPAAGEPRLRFIEFYSPT